MFGHKIARIGGARTSKDSAAYYPGAVMVMSVSLLVMG